MSRACHIRGESVPLLFVASAGAVSDAAQRAQYQQARRP